MKYLENELLIPFNIRDKHGMWYDIDSFDWDKLKLLVQQSLFGKLGHRDGTIELSEISHQITNIEVKNSGVYGDIKVLDFGYGAKLNVLINGGVDIVFRNAGVTECNVNTSRVIFYEIWGFNAIPKKDDIYGDIIYRKDKLKKILHEIKEGR